jgi:hypothetical protein
MRQFTITRTLAIITAIALSSVSIMSAQAATPTATLHLTPGATTVLKDGTITVALTVDTGGQAVVGAKVSITYSDNLTYTGASYDNSIFTAETDNGTGKPFVIGRLRFDSGYTGSNGHIATLSFKALSAGSATVTIEEDNSQVVTFSDGTDILSAVSNAQFAIVEPTTTTTTQESTTSTTSTTTTTVSSPTAAAVTTVTKTSPSPATKKKTSTTAKAKPTPTPTKLAKQASPRPASPSPTPVISHTPTAVTSPLAAALATAPEPSPSPALTEDVRTPATINWPPIIAALIVAALGLIALPFALREAFRRLRAQ